MIPLIMFNVFMQVMSVVKEQIIRVLNEKPDTIELFKVSFVCILYSFKALQSECSFRTLTLIFLIACPLQ